MGTETGQDEATTPTTVDVEGLSAACVDAVPEGVDWSEGWGKQWESWEAIECEGCGRTIVGPDDHGPNLLEKEPVELDESDIPADHPVRPLKAREHPKGETECGSCLLRWDDDVVTSMTPTPSARCPFEHYHEYQPTECEYAGQDAMELGAEGPMMSYRYPVETFASGEGGAAHLIAHLPLCVVYSHEEDSYYLAPTGGGMDFTWEICRGYIALGLLPPLYFCELPKMAGPLGGDALGVVLACMRTVEVAAGRLERTRERLAEVQEWVWEQEYTPEQSTCVQCQQPITRDARGPVYGWRSGDEERICPKGGERSSTTGFHTPTEIR